MEIEFDPTKDAVNIAKHGMPLVLARSFEFETAKLSKDDRFDYGEDRFIALGKIAGRVHVMIFTIRTRSVRVISLRKANSREVKAYEA